MDVKFFKKRILNLEIKQIQAAETYALRHSLLRSGQPLESCRFEGDENPDVFHWGAFSDAMLVGIISAYPNICEACAKQKSYQLRGAAVIPKMQRKGIAKKLIQKATLFLKEDMGVKCVWLNARIKALALYENTGFMRTGAVFDIPDIGLHQRFLKKL